MSQHEDWPGRLAETDPATPENINEQYAQWEKERLERVTAIRRDGYAVGRSMIAFGEIRTEEQWREVWTKAEESYESGRFLVEQLGAEHFLDPSMMAILWSLRQRLLEQFDAYGPAECMLVDMVIVGYYHTLKVQRMIGDSVSSTEYELFGRNSPTPTFKREYGMVSGLRVEDIVERLVQDLYPLMDRSNRFMLRNLRALKELRAPAAPAVSIQQAGQVNVGSVQQNTATAPADDAIAAPGKRGKRKRA